MRRKTYAYNSITIGLLLGILIWGRTKSVFLGGLVCLVVSIVGFVIFRAIENACDAGVNAAVGAVKNSYQQHKDSQRVNTGTIGNGWKCYCGATNPSYINVCSCGKVKPQGKTGNSTNEWKCVCGQWNPNYCGTCGCGMRKSESVAELKRRSEKAKEAIRQKNKNIENAKSQTENDLNKVENTESLQLLSEKDKVKLLKEYKELLDNGILSEEEFNAKKASILKDGK